MSRRTLMIAVLAATPLFSLIVSSAQAQDPQVPAAEVDVDSIEIESSQVTATPEMWFYMQEMRRYDDPAQAVRANAQFRAAQRQARLAATRWYGVSNSRPRVGTTPFMGTYDPQISGSYPGYYWQGRGLLVRPSSGTTLR